MFLFKHTIKQAKITLSLLLLCFGVQLQAADMLEIEITQAMEGALPLAVIPFTFEGESSLLPQTNIATIIRNDLARSGEFSILPSSAIIQQPLMPQEVVYEAWQRLEVDNILMGRISPQGARYRVEIDLLDVNRAMSRPQSAVILSEAFEVSDDELRYLAHYISDTVYEMLTGYPGVFSTRIAYVTTKEAEDDRMVYTLQVADADGFNPQSLLISPQPITSLAWSPDGESIAYVSFEDSRAHIYISDVATGRRRQLSALPGINSAPAWSPDGRTLALVLSHEKIPKIYTLSLSDGELTQLTSGWAIDTEPNWSADGRSIIFTSNRGGGPQIYQVDVATQVVKRLTFEGNYNASPVLTPDLKHIVMIHRPQEAAYGDFSIALLSLENGQLQLLTENGQNNSPSIAPNGRMILYSTKVGGHRVLGAVSIDGKVRLLLPAAEGEVQYPAWSPYATS